ncbi:MAG: hypothetical protein QGF16_10790, partial [Rhodospirillales bacterium]|nr:hypothetical protein [Rhodospirillales bacterium]
ADRGLAVDVLDRDDLPFPESLPGFQRLFPDDAACAAYLEKARWNDGFTFRFNRRFYPFNAFRSLLGIAGDTTAPTRAGLYSGEWQHPTCCGYGR